MTLSRRDLGPLTGVYAQELIPGRTGMVSGLFFGVGGIGAAILGSLTDLAGIDAVYQTCAFLPAIGLLTVLLPNVDNAATKRAAQVLLTSAFGYDAVENRPVR